MKCADDLKHSYQTEVGYGLTGGGQAASNPLFLAVHARTRNSLAKREIAFLAFFDSHLQLTRNARNRFYSVFRLTIAIHSQREISIFLAFFDLHLQFTRNARNQWFSFIRLALAIHSLHENLRFSIFVMRKRFFLSHWHLLSKKSWILAFFYPYLHSFAAKNRISRLLPFSWFSLSTLSSPIILKKEIIKKICRNFEKIMRRLWENYEKILWKKLENF